jgi:hypothetical protein
VFFEQTPCRSCGARIVFEAARLRFRLLEGAIPCANRTLIGCNWTADLDAIYRPSHFFSLAQDNQDCFNMMSRPDVAKADRAVRAFFSEARLPLTAAPPVSPYQAKQSAGLPPL